MNILLLRFVFDRKKEASETKKATLYIEVREKNTSNKVYLSTGIKLFSNQFSKKNGFTCKNHVNANIITGRARNMFRDIELFSTSEKCNNIQDIKNWDKEDNTFSVIDFIKKDIKARNPSFSVVEYNNSFITRLEEFEKIQTFKDITYQNIEEFDLFLRKTIKSQPTLYKRHSLFKGYIERACKKGLCKQNPYHDFKIQKGKSKEPVFLFQDEVNSIINHVFEGALKERLERTRDLFIFQCFTGYSYADMSKFSNDDVIEFNGQKELRSYRQKTGEDFVILFLPQAEIIAEKYNYELPIISNQKYNDYLKLIASECKINKQITSHTARHTFAIYLIEKELPIEIISRILGHTNIKQTQHYARLRSKVVIDKMKEKLL